MISKTLFCECIDNYLKKFHLMNEATAEIFNIGIFDNTFFAEANDYFIYALAEGINSNWPSEMIEAAIQSYLWDNIDFDIEDENLYRVLKEEFNNGIDSAENIYDFFVNN